MSSPREAVIQAVVSLLTTAVPSFEVKRNVTTPQRLSSGGLVIVRDGDPGEPETILSPLTYTWSHAIQIEVLAHAAGDARHLSLDDALRAVGSAIEVNRTLGGLTEWLEPTAPETDDVIEPNAEAVRWAGFDLNAVYSTQNPLG